MYPHKIRLFRLNEVEVYCCSLTLHPVKKYGEVGKM
jgi:hypothetical protein